MKMTHESITMEADYKMLRATMEVMACGEDRGLTPASDPRLPTHPICDLCLKSRSVGHLVHCDRVVVCRIDGSSVEVFTEPEDTEEPHASFWICPSCMAGLREDTLKLFHDLCRDRA